MDTFLSGNYGIFNALFFFMNKFSAEGVTPPNGKCFGVFNLLWSYIALISVIVGWKGNKVNIINQMWLLVFLRGYKLPQIFPLFANIMQTIEITKKYLIKKSNFLRLLFILNS